MMHNSQQSKAYVQKQILAFFANLGLLGAAIFHLHSATTLNTYDNPLSPTNPQVNFQAFVAPNAKLLAYCGLLQIMASLGTIFSLLFLVNPPKFITCIVNVIEAILTLGLCWVIPIQIMLASSSWNRINNAPPSIINLFSSIFIGDISGLQSIMNAEIYTALLFLAFAIYNVYYWSGLFVKGLSENKNKQADT